MSEMLKSSTADRANAKKVAVVITDGVDNMQRWLMVPYAVDARNNGVYIVTLAIGMLADTVMLNSIASPPTSKSVFLAHYGYQLSDFRDRLYLTTCDGIPFLTTSAMQRYGRGQQLIEAYSTY